MRLDELADTAVDVLPPLVIGGVAVRVIFDHPSVWVYLVGVAITATLYGTARRLLKERHGRKNQGP